ncbi:TPA: hypothetical protein DCS34_02200 [Candidatus Peribacteria bacterium]|nr:hypothetical protein [Candidatus Peribacteria bacterium]
MLHGMDECRLTVGIREQCSPCAGIGGASDERCPGHPCPIVCIAASIADWSVGRGAACAIQVLHSRTLRPKTMLKASFMGTSV